MGGNQLNDRVDYCYLRKVEIADDFRSRVDRKRRDAPIVRLKVSAFLRVQPPAAVGGSSIASAHGPRATPLHPSRFSFCHCHRPDSSKEEMKKMKGTEEEEVD